MMKSTLLIFLMLFTCCLFFPAEVLHAQNKKEKGKLGEFEEEVKKKDSDDEEDSEDESHYSIDDGGSDSFLMDVFWDASFRAVVDLLFIFPDEDSLLYGGSFGNVGFSDFPYSDPEEGLFTRFSDKKFSINLSSHYFYDESNLTGLGFRGRFSPHPLFGFAVHFTDLNEQLSGGGESNLQLYSFFLNYNRLRLERLDVWWGLGLKGMHGTIKKTGFAFDGGGEWFLAKPLSLNFEYSGGYLNSRYIPEWYVTLNVHFSRFALVGGYQYWSAGNVVIDGLILGGKIFF